MFAASYFGKRYYAGTYYPPVEVTDAPVTEPNSGGFLSAYDAEMVRRARLARKRKQREDAAEAIDDSVSRDIAKLLRQQEAIDAQRKERERLLALVRVHREVETDSDRVRLALAQAQADASLAALERLERELQRFNEEEEFLLAAFVLLDD